MFFVPLARLLNFSKGITGLTANRARNIRYWPALSEKAHGVQPEGSLLLLDYYPNNNTLKFTWP